MFVSRGADAPLLKQHTTAIRQRLQCIAYTVTHHTPHTSVSVCVSLTVATSTFLSAAQLRLLRPLKLSTRSMSQ